MMIDVTVKTLDLRNHLFSVSEELTVKEFKEVISPTVSIPVEDQRLIFRGRILHDDKKILEYNIGNNTVHLVQRPHHHGESTQNDEPPQHSRGVGGGEQTTGSRNPISGIPSRNSAAVRLQIANDMIGKASNLLKRLEEDDEIAATLAAASTFSSSSSSSTTEENQEMDIVATDDSNSLGRVMTQVANAASATAVFVSVHTIHSGGSDGSDDDTTDGQYGQNFSTTGGDETPPPNQTLPLPQESPRPREMATALQDVIAFHQRLTPFLQFVQNILRDNSLLNTDTGELQSMQYAYDTVTSILHYVGHSYHAYSDLLCDFSTTPEDRRLTAQVLADQSIPFTVLPVSFGTAPQQQETPSTVPTQTSSQNVPLSQSLAAGLNFNSLQGGININTDPSGSGNATTISGNNPFANLQQSIRNHMMRPSFDMLLPCSSHHINRTRRRPANLHQHVQVSQESTIDGAISGEETHDFFESFSELIRSSTWLEMLQPYFKDIIQNYLMRGRDSTNEAHIKTCARSLAKKLMPFFQSLKDTIPVKNDSVDYPNTLIGLVSKLYFKLMHKILSTGPIDGLRSFILSTWEESMCHLFTIFRHCFPNNNRVPEIVAAHLVENFFTGMPLVFRERIRNSLEKYFTAIYLSAERKNIDVQTAGLIYKPDEESIDEEISASVAQNMARLSTTQDPMGAISLLLSGNPTSTSSLTKAPAPFTGDTMETDIDDLIASPTPFPSSRVESSLNDVAKSESPFRHIPDEWRDTVRHDIQRQMCMPDPLPPSRGFFALFPRKE